MSYGIIFDNDNASLDKLATKLNNKHKHNNIISPHNDYISYMDPQYNYGLTNNQYIGSETPYTNNDSLFDKSTNNSSKNTMKKNKYEKNNVSDSVFSNTTNDTFYTKKRKSVHFGKNNNNTTDYSNFTDTDISSNYSILPQKIKNNLKSSLKHINTYNEQDIINHLKSCTQCKQEIISLLHNGMPYNMNNGNNTNNLQQHGILNLSMLEIKDILILILVGVFIIIIFNMFTK